MNAPKFKNSLLIVSLLLNVIFIVLVFIYVSRNKESLTQKFVGQFNTETLIMFGDSHIANGNWNELLGRCDVLKIGFGGLTSDQLKIIMKLQITDRNASYCFIQCGGNDLGQKEYDPNRMIENIDWMINYLKENEIVPVLQSLFHRPNHNYNLTIDSLNVGLKQLALNNELFVKQLDAALMNAHLPPNILREMILDVNNEQPTILFQCLDQSILPYAFDVLGY